MVYSCAEGTTINKSVVEVQGINGCGVEDNFGTVLWIFVHQTGSLGFGWFSALLSLSTNKPRQNPVPPQLLLFGKPPLVAYGSRLKKGTKVGREQKERKREKKNIICHKTDHFNEENFSYEKKTSDWE